MATGETSLWYKLTFAATILLNDRSDRAEWLRNQIWLDSSSDIGLDLWGQRFGIPRNYGELDDDYRARIILERMIGGDASNKSRQQILQAIMGIDPAQIRIERVIDDHFAMGAPIGSPVGSRDYAMHVYRIYAPCPTDYQDRVDKVSKMLDKINIGGNYWELWLETGIQSGQPTNNDDRPIGGENAETSPLKSYIII